MIQTPVYLDNHATTRPDPRALAAMWPYFTEHFGNAASVAHPFGWEAAGAVERAREQVAAALGCEARAIVFTSGATESDNLALKGALPALRARGDHIVSAATEHRAVLDPLKRLAREGWRVTFVASDATGMVHPEAIEAALTERTVLVSVMAANNEVGTLNPIAAIGQICRARGIVFHTDATQAVGKVPLDVEETCVDLLSFTAHKLHGPKGIGALYVRRSGSPVRIAPLFDGGGHERGTRSGTLPVPLIVGLGEAVALAAAERPEEATRLVTFRHRLFEKLRAELDDVRLNGHPTERLPGNLNVSFPGVDGEVLITSLRDVAVSSGAACTSAERAPSHVLRAMGVPEALTRASLRFGIGRFNTVDEIDFAAEAVAHVVKRLRRAPTP